MKIINNFRIYTREAKRLKREYPKNINSILELMWFFPAWYQSRGANASPLADERPWLTFAAIRFLEQNLTRDMRVFEYGSGGSTLFFAEHVKAGVSVEHDLVWKKKVSEALRQKGYRNWQMRVFELPFNASLLQDPSDPNSYASGRIRYRKQSFKDYAISIEEYPDGYFDVVLIDGRARPSCFKHAVNKVSEKGCIILDDADRDHYCYIHKSLNNRHWEKKIFCGPRPYSDYFWQTTIWQKVD